MCVAYHVKHGSSCERHVDVTRLSVVSVSAMVHKFKDTKLSSVALKSDKVKVVEF